MDARAQADKHIPAARALLSEQWKNDDTRDARAQCASLDGFLGAAARDLNSFVGYGGQLMVGATIL